MIKLLDVLAFLLTCAHTFVLLSIIKSFLPLRRIKGLLILALIAFQYIAAVVIYSNDIAGLLGSMLAFGIYLCLFHKGKLIEKMSTLFIFYPPLIAVNYLMQDIGSRIFYTIAPSAVDEAAYSQSAMLVSSVVYALSTLFRLLFWLGAGTVLCRFLSKITSALNTRTWLLIDALAFASFIAIFTVIFYMPENTWIAYPICGASIFSSFGCIYLISYIRDSMQTAYRAQELEMQYNYYQDRLQEEEKVRSVYHDLKNHLLILQAQSGDSQETQRSVRELQEQIRGFENYCHTGNAMLDIIIRDKAKAAQEKQIDFSASVQFQDGGFIELLDISAIFGNALDNAIEASEKLPKEQRLITVKGGRIRDMLSIVVMNNTVAEVPFTLKTDKEEKNMHGFGLGNIKKAVEKYDGQCVTKLEKGSFTIKLLLPIPE